MTNKESNEYFRRNIKKYVLFIDAIKELKYLIEPSTNRYIKRYVKYNGVASKLQRNNRILIDKIYCVYQMYEMMNKTDEIILNIKRKKILEIIKKVTNEYSIDIYSPRTTCSTLRYLRDKGILKNSNQKY
jgi:hypothetical protein